MDAKDSSQREGNAQSQDVKQFSLSTVLKKYWWLWIGIGVIFFLDWWIFNIFDDFFPQLCGFYRFSEGQYPSLIYIST